MRAKEFIIERSFSKRISGPMNTTFQFPTMPSSDGYQAYRFGIAMADHTMTHGIGPTNRNAVIVAYTPEEETIIKSAAKQTGHKGVLVADKSSHELTSTGTHSPVARPKRNRYGV